MKTEIRWLSKSRLNNISAAKDLQNEKLFSMFKEARHDFQKDLGQAKHLAQFRALSGKTQVRTLSDDTVRNRLTHSLEVSDIATQIMGFSDRYALQYFVRSSGKKDQDFAVYKNTHEARSAIETICLLHDLGHPPFAHTGEKFLQESDLLKGTTQENFDSNIQTLRFLSHELPNGEHWGLNFTVAVLDGLMKAKPRGHFNTKLRSKKGTHITTSEWFLKYSDEISTKNGTKIETTAPANKKQIERIKAFCNEIGVDFSELISDSDPDYQKLTCIWARSPLSLCMEIADDISYISSDLEDALDQDLISIEKVKQILRDEKFSHIVNTNFEKVETDKFIDDNCKGHFSKLKSALIRLMICRVNLVTLAVNSIWNKLNKDKSGTRIDFFNDLPFSWMAMSIKYSNKDEIGNPLYFSEEIFKHLPKNLHDNKELMIFMKPNPLILKIRLLRDSIISHRSVAFENRIGKAALSAISSEIIPGNCEVWKLFKREVQEKATMIEEPFRKAVLDLLDKCEESLPNNDNFHKQIRSIFVDFIASLEDKQAIKLAEEIQNRRTKLRMLSAS